MPIGGTHTFPALDTSNAFTGINTFGQINGEFWVDGVNYATCAAAVAAAGGVNKAIVNLPNSYPGTACPPDTSYNNPNITIFDWSGTQNPNNAPFNGMSINGNDGNVQWLFRSNFAHQTYSGANAATVTGYFINTLTNSTPPNGATADGISAEVDLFGTLIGTLGHAQAAEHSVTVASNGGTITDSSGVLGFVSVSGTTQVGTVHSIWARGCLTITGTAPTNCYGLQADDQGNKGASRNYALYGIGRNLIGYSSVTSIASITFEDHLNGTHFPQLYVDSTDAFQIAALTNTGGVLIQDAGLNNKVKVDNTGTKFFTGVNGDGSGLKHKRGTAGCATAAAAGAACTTTVTWATAFADANYTVQCGGRLVTSGVPSNGGITAQIAASVTFQTVAETAAAAQFTNIDCIAIHD